MIENWPDGGDGRPHRSESEESREYLDLVGSLADAAEARESPGDSRRPGGAAPELAGQARHLATIAALERRIAELEPLGARLADTEQRRVALEVQIRTVEEERDRLASERIERAALKRRNDRLEHELARTRELSETAQRELNETRQHVMQDQESTQDWSREALRLRKQLDEAERRATDARRRLKTAGDALGLAVDGSRPVRRGDLVRLAQLMVLDSGSADAMVDEVRKLFPR